MYSNYDNFGIFRSPPIPVATNAQRETFSVTVQSNIRLYKNGAFRFQFLAKERRTKQCRRIKHLCCFAAGI